MSQYIFLLLFSLVFFQSQALYKSSNAIQENTVGVSTNYNVARQRRSHDMEEIPSVIQAALKNDFSKIQELVKAQPTVIDSKRSGGRTALHEVVNRGNMIMAKCLLHYGASPSEQDDSGWAPLHIAAHCGWKPLVSLLCNAEADLDSKTDKGKSALSLAASRNHVEIAQLLIMMGADIRSADNNGFTALHSACHHGYRTMALLLLEAGASPNVKTRNVKNYSMRTPLEMAVIGNRLYIVLDMLFSLYRTKTQYCVNNGEGDIERSYQRVDIENYKRVLHIAKKRGLTEIAGWLTFFNQPIGTISYTLRTGRSSC